MDITLSIVSIIYLTTVLICMWCIILLNKKLDDKIQDSNYYREQLTKDRNSRCNRQHKIDQQINRMRLAIFFWLNDEKESCLDLLTGRTSNDAVLKDLYQIRKALEKEGKISKLWVLEETDEANKILHGSD